MIYVADMAILMSNFDNFDNDLENLLKDSTLSSISIAKKILS